MNAIAAKPTNTLLAQRQQPEQTWYAGVPRSGKSPTLWGYAIMVAGLGGFIAWATTAPLEGAVLSPGNFVATTQNKIVQHFEGGIIDQIAVKEGDIVTAGQMLLKLDGTAARANLRRLELRHSELRIAEARLRAEMRGADTVTLPDELVLAARSDADIKAALDDQLSMFKARHLRLSSDLEIQAQAAESFQHKIKGDTERKAAIEAQLAIAGEELADKEQLQQRGLVRKPEYLALRRLAENLKGEISRLNAEIEESIDRIEAVQQQAQKIRTTAKENATEDLQKTVSELKDVGERMTSAQDVLSRLLIKAPVAGAVVKLNYHTPGGVIQAGHDILALLPSGDELVIETRVRPQDIDNVRVGLQAYIRLTALNQRTTPMIPGEVIYVSADAVPNDKRSATDENIYVARIRLNAAEIAKVENFAPTPGMPAEVFIKTKNRTFFKYLVQPVLDTMSHAFRES